MVSFQSVVFSLKDITCQLRRTVEQAVVLIYLKNIKLKIKKSKMSKFKVLEYHETILTFLGMRFHRLAENSNEFFISILPYYLLITSLSSVLSTGMFIYLNWPNLEVILRTSSIIFIAMIQVSGMFLSFGFSMKTVKSLHFRLQEIIDKQGESRMLWNHFVFHFNNSDSEKKTIFEKLKTIRPSIAIWSFYSIKLTFPHHFSIHAWLIQIQRVMCSKCTGELRKSVAIIPR